MTAPIAYPSILPRFSVQGYGYAPDDAVLATELDTGPRRLRQRFTATPTRYTVQSVFTLIELAVFEYWHANVVGQGVSWFSVPLVQGAGYLNVDARFIGSFTTGALNGRHYTVSASLEVRQRPVITEESYELILSLGIEGYSQFGLLLNQLQQLVNNDLEIA